MKRQTKVSSNSHRQWLHWDSITETVIDFENVQIYEGQEEEGYQNVADYLHQVVQPNMRLEPEVFVVEHVLNGKGTLSNLLTTREYFTTEYLADLYGIEIDYNQPTTYWESSSSLIGEEEVVYDGEFISFQAPETERAGILTTLGFLHSTSNPLNPSPVQEDSCP